MAEPKVSPYRAYLTEIDPSQYFWAAREVAKRDGVARIESSRDHAERQETRKAEAARERRQANAEKTYDRIVAFEELREALRLAREKQWGIANDNDKGRDNGKER